MRILVTNDDGISAPGLAVLEAIAADLAGSDGEVWTVAPAFEQSGVGHCISYTHPSILSELGPRRFAAEGSPADCVLAALHVVMKDHRPDLVLSGVNRGNNSAENALYSGTLGGAMEGALQGVPAMALSQYFGSENRDLDNPFEAARQHGADVVRKLLAAQPANDQPYGLFYNINFPRLPPPMSKARASPRRAAARASGSRRKSSSRPTESASSGSRAATSRSAPHPAPMRRRTLRASSLSHRCGRILRRMTRWRP